MLDDQTAIGLRLIFGLMLAVALGIVALDVGGFVMELVMAALGVPP